MIRHVFVFGVITPMIITVLFFIGFLVCWFKFNLAEKILKFRLWNKRSLVCPHSTSAQPCGRHTKPSWINENGTEGNEIVISVNVNDNNFTPPDDESCADCDDTISQCSLDDSESTRLCPGTTEQVDSHIDPSTCKDTEGERPAAGEVYPGDDTWCDRQETVDLVHQTFHFPVNQDSPSDGAIEEKWNYGYFFHNNSVKTDTRFAKQKARKMIHSVKNDNVTNSPQISAK